MELRGFELGNIDLELGEEVYDLQNNFFFRGFSYNVATRELVLRWARGTGEWIPWAARVKSFLRFARFRTCPL